MATGWIVPEYSKKQVNRAGEVLCRQDASEQERRLALGILDNWRAAHGFPLNTIQVGLRRNARRVYPKALIAQRLKRVQSIVPKLERFPSMKLSQMQDIGGCRAVLRTSSDVRSVCKLYEMSKSRHTCVRMDDYIQDPTEDGYRGIHLVYRFEGPNSPEYIGLKIEVQLRSILQHAWATAVETVGTFLRQALKSRQGEKEWLDFFRLAGSAFAVLEGTPPVPGMPASRRQLLRELRALEQDLEVRTRLQNFRQALRLVSRPRTAEYYLLSLNAAEKVLSVQGYRRGQLERAARDYASAEMQLSLFPGDIVLVAADSIKALKRAYPNYFLDTQVFLRQLDRVLQ